jgi:hypothetical protein
MTDLNPPDRLAEITERHVRGYWYQSPVGRTSNFSAAVEDVAWLLGELVETRTLADTLRAYESSLVLEARARTEDCADANTRHVTALRELKAALAERDVERARADQLQADLDASRAEVATWESPHCPSSRNPVLSMWCDRAEALRKALAKQGSLCELSHYTQEEWSAREAELVVLREQVATLTQAIEKAVERFAQIPARYQHSETAAIKMHLRVALQVLAGSVGTPPPTKEHHDRS